MRPATRMVVLTQGGRKQLWTPAALGSSLALWLDADDFSTITLNGSTVSQWDDKSGNGRHASQATLSSQPTYTANGLNGKPAILFNGTSTFMDVPSLVMTGQNWTFITVASMSGSTQRYARLASAVRSVGSGGSGADHNDSASWVVLNRLAFINAVQSAGVTPGLNVSLDTPYVIRVTRNSGDNAIALDGGTPVITTTVLLDLNTTSGVRIGRSINPSFESNEHWAGSVSEMIFVQNLSIADQQKLVGYLAHKRDSTANLPSGHPFKFTPPYV